MKITQAAHRRQKILEKKEKIQARWHNSIAALTFPLWFWCVPFAVGSFIFAWIKNRIFPYWKICPDAGWLIRCKKCREFHPCYEEEAKQAGAK